jgi:hypothetical protein
MVVVMIALVSSKLKRAREEDESICYGPRLEADKHVEKNLSLIYNSTDVECIAMLRMSIAPFFSLCNLFRQRGLVVDSINSLVEEQVAMFLHVVWHNKRFRVVHQSFRRSIETVSIHFHHVLYAIGELRDELIKPQSSSTHVKILDSHKWNPFFKVIVGYLASIILGLGSCLNTYVSSFILDCIGAIDDTHMLARVTRHM